MAAAQTQVRFFADALEDYRTDLEAYPTSAQGLEALVHVPSDLRRTDTWNGPYVPDVQVVPLDPWGNEYAYEPGAEGRSCLVT